MQSDIEVTNCIPDIQNKQIPEEQSKIIKERQNNISKNINSKIESFLTKQDQSVNVSISKKCICMMDNEQPFDFVEYMQKRNCMECGTFIINNEESINEAQQQIKVLKHNDDFYHSDMSPSELYSFLLLEESSYRYKQIKSKIQPLSLNLQKTRRSLVDWIFDIGERLKQRQITIHLAVLYLDILLQDDKIFEKQKQEVVTLTCILLASKFDELDDQIPLIRDLQRISSRSKIHYDDIIKCEVFLLSKLNWDLFKITPCHFVQNLLGQGIVFSTDKQNQIENDELPLNSVCDLQQIDDKTLKSVKKYSEFFSDLAVQEYELQINFKPSVISIACIVCARYVSKITPEWNQIGFEQLTDYIYDGEVKQCTDKLMKIYEKHHFSKTIVQSTKSLSMTPQNTNGNKQSKHNKENQIKKGSESQMALMTKANTSQSTIVIPQKQNLIAITNQQSILIDQINTNKEVMLINNTLASQNDINQKSQLVVENDQNLKSSEIPQNYLNPELYNEDQPKLSLTGSSQSNYQEEHAQSPFILNSQQKQSNSNNISCIHYCSQSTREVIINDKSQDATNKGATQKQRLSQQLQNNAQHSRKRKDCSQKRQETIIQKRDNNLQEKKANQSKNKNSQHSKNGKQFQNSKQQILKDEESQYLNIKLYPPLTAKNQEQQCIKLNSNNNIQQSSAILSCRTNIMHNLSSAITQECSINKQENQTISSRNYQEANLNQQQNSQLFEQKDKMSNIQQILGSAGKSLKKNNNLIGKKKKNKTKDRLQCDENIESSQIERDVIKMDNSSKNLQNQQHFNNVFQLGNQRQKRSIDLTHTNTKISDFQHTLKKKQSQYLKYVDKDCDLQEQQPAFPPDLFMISQGTKENSQIRGKTVIKSSQYNNQINQITNNCCSKQSQWNNKQKCSKLQRTNSSLIQNQDEVQNNIDYCSGQIKTIKEQSQKLKKQLKNSKVNIKQEETQCLKQNHIKIRDLNHSAYQRLEDQQPHKIINQTQKSKHIQQNSDYHQQFQNENSNKIYKFNMKVLDCLNSPQKIASTFCIEQKHNEPLFEENQQDEMSISILMSQSKNKTQLNQNLSFQQMVTPNNQNFIQKNIDYVSKLNEIVKGKRLYLENVSNAQGQRTTATCSITRNVQNQANGSAMTISQQSQMPDQCCQLSNTMSFQSSFVNASTPTLSKPHKSSFKIPSNFSSALNQQQSQYNSNGNSCSTASGNQQQNLGNTKFIQSQSIVDEVDEEEITEIHSKCNQKQLFKKTKNTNRDQQINQLDQQNQNGEINSRRASQMMLKQQQVIQQIPNQIFNFDYLKPTVASLQRAKSVAPKNKCITIQTGATSQMQQNQNLFQLNNVNQQQNISSFAEISKKQIEEAKAKLQIKQIEDYNISYDLNNKSKCINQQKSPLNIDNQHGEKIKLQKPKNKDENKLSKSRSNKKRQQRHDNRAQSNNRSIVDRSQERCQAKSQINNNNDTDQNVQQCFPSKRSMNSQNKKKLSMTKCQNITSAININNKKCIRDSQISLSFQGCYQINAENIEDECSISNFNIQRQRMTETQCSNSRIQNSIKQNLQINNHCFKQKTNKNENLQEQKNIQSDANNNQECQMTFNNNLMSSRSISELAIPEEEECDNANASQSSGEQIEKVEKIQYNSLKSY